MPTPLSVISNDSNKSLSVYKSFYGISSDMWLKVLFLSANQKFEYGYPHSNGLVNIYSSQAQYFV